MSNNTCMNEILKHIKVDGYISSGWFADTYAVSVKDKDDKSVQTNRTLMNIKKTTKKTDMVMKVAYKSDIGFSEIKAHRFITKQAKKNSPHFSNYLKHFICTDTVLFRGWRKSGIAKSYDDYKSFVHKGPAYIMLSEHAGKSFETNFKKLTFEELFQMFFQVFYTLHVFDINLFEHHDLLISNFTIESLKEPVIWEYIVNDTVYSLKIQNQYIKIIDFGLSRLRERGIKRSRDIDYVMDVMSKIKHNYSFNLFVKNMMKSLYDEDEELKMKYHSPANILEDFFKHFIKTSKSKKANKVWKDK